ncbi:MAG TPA: TlpA disulfide reductase family protein [Thermomicrobiales bacterium]|nr:TlpA disulfide reductase family protein [Thermomicrobiales bacterium]
MPGLLLSLVMLFGLVAPGTPASQPAGCSDLETYFTTAGKHIRDQLSTLLADDDWSQAFDHATSRANEPDMSILALDSDELDPIIDLISVPGNALGEMTDESVPPLAMELHESALQYHRAMPEMLRATNRGGAVASVPFQDTFEEAAANNRAAQQTIRGTCPSLIADITSFGDTNSVVDLNDLLADPRSLNPDILDDMTNDGLRALSFSMLFFMQDDDAPQQDASAPPSSGNSETGEKRGGTGFARIGDPAPDFEMETFDGDTFRLSEHRGEVVIVNFWGSWCDPCRDEMPAFQSAWETADPDVTFVGVGSKRDPEDKAMAFADEFGVTYPIGRDTEGGTAANGQITKDYNIMVFPTTYIVGPDGNISAIVMYAMDMDDLAGYIDQARNP